MKQIGCATKEKLNLLSIGILLMNYVCANERREEEYVQLLC